MAHPLELAYNWRTPTLFATVGLVVCLGILIRSGTPDWPPVAAVLLVLWAGFVTLAWARTRSYLMVDGDRLTVRRLRAFVTVRGVDVVRVDQVRTPHGPSYRITARGTDGGLVHAYAPVALLRRGHSTLFAWILTNAPQAELNDGARSTLAELQNRGALR